MGTRIGTYFKGDKVLWGLIVLFGIYSLLSVYSASGRLAWADMGGNTIYYLSRQGMVYLVGVILIFVVHFIPVQLYSSMSKVIFTAVILLLLVTLVMGTRINEASRWLTIPGLGISFQTSDLAKVGLLIYLASQLSQVQHELKNFRTVSRRLVLPVGLICALILPENFSTAAILFATCLVLMFVGRVPFRFLLAYVGLGIAGIVLVVALISLFSENNRINVWKNRVEHFISGEDEDNYQAQQAKIAVATGGLFGKSPGKSTQRNMLPQSNSDFIYAIIIEEYGMVFGAIPIVLMYLFIMFRAISIVRKCVTAFPAFLVMGMALMIVLQAMINMGVAVNLLPVTGQPLPMISWGRTSMVMTSFAMGIILSVSRANNERLLKEEAGPEASPEEEAEAVSAAPGEAPLQSLEQLNADYEL